MRLISLEQTFKELCEKHDHLKLLESQWRFDRELISKALQNINSIFPHYSRHDASHSRQIIVNIERMLGDRLLHLTATDMWLILESAYNHDIGMVITHKQIQDMNTPEFSSFIRNIANETEHELHEFSVKWLNGEAILPNGADAHVFFDEYRQILAEWYRRKHPENAAKIIRDPFEEIGLSSPRNELLPKRLFGVLASICNAHGQPFDEVMKLPFSEAGMATEDCHPRYVAFLLRMADLLDVDDNRFCPVMMRMSGASLPASSHVHLEKHQGIKHLRLDSERIKIEVVCPSPDSYEVAHDWFKWLEKEYHNQSQHWPKIVPSKKLGRLPTLSPIKVSLQKPYLIINEGKKPTFDLNQPAILKLLRSTGLYTSKLDSIREILQNAVDSTIIAIWESNKEQIVNLDPSSNEMFLLYDKRKIIVDFLPKKNNPNLFTLTVKDSGTGISKSDLERMLKVGSSNKNSSRSELIRDMPEWFKPSGNFGIGLQSINLLSNSFTITTKSRSTHEALKLTFNLEKGSSIVIESIDHNSVEYGAIVSVDISIDEFPQRISLSWNEIGSILEEQINAYDFTEEGSNLKIYEQLKILQAIQDFNDGSPIKISSAQHALSSEREKVYFSREQNICLSNIEFADIERCSLSTYFRGQVFNGLNFALPLIRGKIDFYGYQAIDFLTYNREKILPQIISDAANKTIKALLEFINSNFNDMSESEKPFAAAFYYLYSRNENENENENEITKYEIDLLNYPIRIENADEINLNQIIEKIKDETIDTIEIHTQNKTSIQAIDALEKTHPNIAVLINDSSIATLTLIKSLTTKSGLYWQEQTSKEPYGTRCYWSRKDIIPVDKIILKEIMSGSKGYLEFGKRLIFPAWGKYKALSINANIPWARTKKHLSNNSEVLVLPYAFNYNAPAYPDKTENLIEWVYSHRNDKTVSHEKISSLYDELIKEIDDICSEE